MFSAQNPPPPLMCPRGGCAGFRLCENTHFSSHLVFQHGTIRKNFSFLPFFPSTEREQWEYHLRFVLRTRISGRYVTFILSPAECCVLEPSAEGSRNIFSPIPGIFKPKFFQPSAYVAITKIQQNYKAF